jgi:hypothetical protein
MSSNLSPPKKEKSRMVILIGEETGIGSYLMAI